MSNRKQLPRPLFTGLVLCLALTSPVSTQTGGIVRQIDEKAVKLLAEVQAKLRTAKTVTAEVSSSMVDEKGNPSPWGTTSATYKLAHPALVVVTEYRANREGKVDTSMSGFDGKIRWYHRMGDSTYTSYPAEGARVVEMISSPALATFFPTPSEGRPPRWDPDRLNDLTLRSLRLVGKESRDGKEYDVIEWRYVPGFAYPEDSIAYTAKMLVAGDRTIRRIEVTNNITKYREEHELRSIAFNESLGPKAFLPPPGTAEAPRATVPAPPPAPVTGGLKATPFNLETAAGGQVTLDSLLAGKKMLMIHMWAYS
jgi:hypothetical protein